MARERASDGVPVNAVTPGPIQTDITGGKLAPELKIGLAEGFPLGRFGFADDVANACLFLASDLSSSITDAVIDVNGDMMIH